MSILNEILTFEYESAYDYAYDLPVKKNYSTPKIYTANGDLKKRWYVYFSYRNPKTGKLKRITPIYGSANKYKTKEERLTILTAYRKSLLKFLKQGYNPYNNNNEIHRTKIDVPSQVVNTKKNESDRNVSEEKRMTLEEAFNFGLKLKEKLISSKTKSNYENRIKNFLKWLAENHSEIITINQLTKKSVTEFLNDVLGRTSSRTRNNFRVDLSSIFQVLVDNEIVFHNFIKTIPVLKSIPQRNKTYTTEKQVEIFNYLEQEDPTLLLFIKFVSYAFVRPIEACRLKIGDLDLENRTMQFKAKNSPFKTKIIPELLLNDLPDLSKLDKDLLLFTPDKIGDEWEATPENRRDYFTKQFKKVIKDHFKLGKDHGIYSFRHTYITKVYRELVKNCSPTEAEGKLMLITGHATVTALRKYLREIDAELPADYSAMLK